MNAQIEDPNLWNDPQKAAHLMAERTGLVHKRDVILELEQRYQDALELMELAENENDGAVLQEAEKDFFALEPVFQKAELESLLSGEADANDAFLEIHAGAGEQKPKIGPLCWNECI